MTGSEFAPATMPAPVPLPPIADATPPGPAVVADTTPIVGGMELPPPPSTSLVVPPVSYLGPVAAPVAAPAAPASTVPTWAWVLGGAALLGLLGFIAWTAMRPAVAPAASRSNPLRMGHGTQRRFRRVRRAKRRSAR